MAASSLTAEQAIARLRAAEPELRAKGVTALYIFGSTARDEARPDSDVDVLCEFDPKATIGTFGFLDVRERLEQILARQVDLVERDGLHRLIRNDVVNQARSVFR